MGSKKLPTGVTRRPNGRFQVRISKGGRRYNIGTFKTRREATDALGEALFNVPAQHEEKFEPTPVGDPAYNPPKEPLKKRLKRIVERVKAYLETV